MASAARSDGGLRGADLFVRGARSYPPGPDASALDVRIRGGVIEAVGAELASDGLPVLEAHGLTVIPGLVDVHVHFRDPGLEHKEGWDHGSAGALHGGVTSVVEVQNNPPLSTSREALEARLVHVRERSRVDFGCLANLLPESVPELAAMAPLTPAFKLFLGGSTGLGGETDDGVLRELFAAAARAGRPIVGHCEDEELLRAGKRAFPDATATEHHLVRSAQAEIESVRKSIAWVQETGASLHVFHVSTRGACELIGAARRRGLPVRGSTGPQYVLLSAEDAVRLGNLMKINPSIKTRDDNAGILAALRAGDVDAIGTDHAPHPLTEKQRAYAHAPSGMPSVDLLWPLTFELVRRGLLDAATALASVTERAAASLWLPRKGRLAPGYDGDVVLFDPEATRRVVGAELPSRSKWSAYEGLELAGFPAVVVRRGEIAFQGGQVLVQAGGRPLDLVPPAPRR
ncbi:MAG: dihydroorotase family protein [Planctomycetes bacterium]|nr:dihydroorotase family protein [Planctomycetota bacterium]